LKEKKVKKHKSNKSKKKRQKNLNLTQKSLIGLCQMEFLKHFNKYVSSYLEIVLIQGKHIVLLAMQIRFKMHSKIFLLPLIRKTQKKTLSKSQNKVQYLRLILVFLVIMMIVDLRLFKIRLF